MNTGLVLEGGGMRGIFTAGILDVFMENNISFDAVIGVSAGAVHGCSYLSGQKGRSLRYYKKYCNDPRFMSVRSLIKTGDIIGVDFCYHELPDKLDIYDHDAFENCGVPFWVVCSNLETGKAEYVRITDMRGQIDYLRASASLPYVSRIVEFDNKKLLDGGVCDSIPIGAARDMGYTRNVVILTRDPSYQKKPEMTALSKLVYRKYPRFIKALHERHLVYNDTLKQISELERRGEIYVIRPESPLDIGRLESDPDNVQRVYDIGREMGKKHLDSMIKWANNGQA